MFNFKIQHVVIMISIIWLSNHECFCNQFEEKNETLLLNETKDDIFQDTEQNELMIGSNTTRDYNVGIHLANWRWNEIGIFYTVSLFIIITGLSKVAFHHVIWLSSHIPESCLLVFVGIVVGAILFVVPPVGDVSSSMPTFTPRLFFLILLPPVILESAYSLYNVTFYENLYTILLFAVMGTIFNTFSIGFLLYALHNIGWMGDWYPGDASGQDVAYIVDINLVEIMIFSALISAVDPVAVLAIFQEVGVNKDLYFLIFGESLLNDAITVVLYNTMVAMASKPTIDSYDYTMAVLSFFTVNLGGIALGIFFGLFTAVITKTTTDVRVVEPLAVLGMAYLSYLSAELFHFSGIISIIFCGLLQAHYSFKNISNKSYVTVKYFTKMVSATSEAIIFLFLGLVLLSHEHNFASGFICWSILVCLICRFVGIFVLTAISNIFRMRKIQLQEQFIMAYGGLRGAVGFSLVIMLDENEAKAKGVFVTTTLAVILFTVFIQGATIKPLVKLLNIEISGIKHKTLIGEINDQVASHLMAGIEEIIGFRGNYYFKRKLMDIDEKYLQNLFLKDKSDNRIRHVFEKTSLTYHYAHLYGPITLVEDNKTEMLHIDSPPAAARLSYIPFVTDTQSLHSKAPDRHPTSSYTEVELRRRNFADVKPGLLKKAFQSNPFQRYFQRYNPNLIEDDTQEIAAQLELRRKRARRITLAAYEPYQNSGKNGLLSDLSDVSDVSLASVRRPVQSAFAQCTREEMIGIENIMQRAEQRKTISHTGHYAIDMGTLKRIKDLASGMSLNDVPSQSSGREQPAESKAEGFTSSNENATPSTSNENATPSTSNENATPSTSNENATPSTSNEKPSTSNEKEIPLQEKPLLSNSDEKNDSEDESQM